MQPLGDFLSLTTPLPGARRMLGLQARRRGGQPGPCFLHWQKCKVRLTSQGQDSSLGHLNKFMSEWLSKWAWSGPLSHLGVGEWQEESKVRGNDLALQILPCWDLTFSAGIYPGSREPNCNAGSVLVALTWEAEVRFSWFICIPSLSSIELKVQIFNGHHLSLGAGNLWDVACETWAKPDYSSAPTLDLRAY